MFQPTFLIRVVMKNLFFLILSALVLGTNLIASPESDLEFSSEINQRICSPTECYTIIEKLGEGAFGEVYAVENSHGEQFALKSYKFHNRFGVENHYYTDMEREFQRGQIFDHPNIIKSYEYFIFEDEISTPSNNLVLQLVKGQTLKNTPKGALSHKESMDASLELLSALNYALSLGMMHLDLHFDNLMLDKDSKVMIIDLASFFTFDELIAGFKKHETAKKQSSNSNSVTMLIDEAQSISSLSNEAELAKGARTLKLEAFFHENPKFIKEMQKISSLDIVKQRYDTQMGTDQHDTSEKQIVNETYRIAMSQYYFGLITEACIKLISVSDLTRDEKMSLRVEIKKIAWNYEADFEDHCSYPIGYYFETLSKLLQTELGENAA
jgi:hypothetical protein